MNRLFPALHFGLSSHHHPH